MQCKLNNRDNKWLFATFHIIFTVLTLFSGVSGTVRECNSKKRSAGCKTQELQMNAKRKRKVYSPYGQNKVCSCDQDFCNSSPWPETLRLTKLRSTPRNHTARRPTVVASLSINEVDSRSTIENGHFTDQRAVTWYSPDTPTDFEGVPLPTDAEGVPLPTDADGVFPRTDSEGVSMLTDHEGGSLPTDSEGVSLPSDSEGVSLPIDSEGVPLPIDSEGVPLPIDSEGVSLPIDSDGVFLRTDFEGVSVFTDSEGVTLPTDSEGVSLPTDSERVPLIEKSMSTQSMDHTLPASYNDHSTDKIQSNGVKALNGDVMFATLLTLIDIFL